MKGQWITTEFKAEPCRIKRGLRKKNGWELKSHLFYYDEPTETMWVLKPGYLWDGPSYPSKASLFGMILQKLVGNRKKHGLLAASAQHDQMDTSHPMMMYHCYDCDVDVWKNIIEYDSEKINRFLDNQLMKEIRLSIRSAAILYWYMIILWPNEEETIGFARAVRQYLGLLIFQPIFRLISPMNQPWEKVDEHK